MLDFLVCGQGPVGIAVANQLLSSGRMVGVLDASGAQDTLKKSTTLSTNIQYISAMQSPSIWYPHSQYSWGGACMGLRDEIFLEQISTFLGTDKERFYDAANKWLEIENFDFFKNRPMDARFTPLAATWLREEALVIRDPSLRKQKATIRSQAKEIHHKILVKIEETKWGIAAHVYDSARNESQKILAKKVVLALGALENARVLLSSVGLINVPKAVGRNLSDHLTWPIATNVLVESSYWRRGFEYRRFRNGSLRWPRYFTSEEKSFDTDFFLFMHRSNLVNLSADLSGSPLRGPITRLQASRLEPYIKKALRASLFVYAEVPNSPQRRIEVVNSDSSKPGPPTAHINFHFSEAEIKDLYHRIHTLASQALSENIIENFGFQSESFKSSAILTTNHPSGTHVAGFDETQAATGLDLKLWGSEGIYAVGSGSYPRSEASHPTLFSIAHSLNVFSII